MIGIGEMSKNWNIFVFWITSVQRDLCQSHVMSLWNGQTGCWFCGKIATRAEIGECQWAGLRIKMCSTLELLMCWMAKRCFWNCSNVIFGIEKRSEAIWIEVNGREVKSKSYWIEMNGREVKSETSWIEVKSESYWIDVKGREVKNEEREVKISKEKKMEEKKN